MLRKGLYYLEGYSMEGSGRFTGRLCNISGRKLCGESWGLWKIHLLTLVAHNDISF
jgi:hypothetical protein